MSNGGTPHSLFRGADRDALVDVVAPRLAAYADPQDTEVRDCDREAAGIVVDAVLVALAERGRLCKRPRVGRTPVRWLSALGRGGR